MLDNKKKLTCLLKLAECCKVIKKYDLSLRFLRKALQYAWNLNFESVEITIYDKMGIIYYLSGDLVRARYYHERFLQNKLEAPESPCKLSSISILGKYFEIHHADNYNIYTTSSVQIIPMILSKLSFTIQVDEKNNSMVFEKKENLVKEKSNQSLFYDCEISDTNHSRAILSTDQSLEIQIQSIFEEKEFLFEIASPRCTFSLI